MPWTTHQHPPAGPHTKGPSTTGIRTPPTSSSRPSRPTRPHEETPASLRHYRRSAGHRIREHWPP
eukprot:8049551-Prorocentrum_lima.AAC.1